MILFVLLTAMFVLAVPAPGQPQSSAAAHVAAGNALLAQKQPAQAEQEFRAALRTDPANKDANFNLGVLSLARGAAAEAILYLEHVRPPTTAARFNLVRAYLEAHRTQEGLRMATQLSAENNGDVKVHFSLGILLASHKQYKPAEIELEKAETLQPDTFEIVYNLGLAFLRDGEFAKAQLALARANKLKPDSPETLFLEAQTLAAQSRPMDALALLIQAHKTVPENTDVILLMAEISMSQHYYEDAIPLLESGIAIAPKRLDLHAALGESYLRTEKNDKAVAEVEKVLAASPSARLYVLLGLSYQRLGRFDEAKRAFAAGLKLEPGNVACLFNLGLIAERQGDSAVARTRFQEALRANPNHADALLELANLRIADENMTEAAVLLKKFVQVSNHPAIGYYKLAMVERSMNNVAETNRDLKLFQTFSRQNQSGNFPNEHLFDYLDNRAHLAPGDRVQQDIADLTAQLKDHPDQPQGLYLLAEAYLRAGNVQEAKDTIAKLDAASTGDYRSLTGAGVLLARYRLYSEAIQHFEQALAIKPDADDVHFDLADALFRGGRYPQALEAMQQVSAPGRTDNAYLALLGDIYAHLGDATRATAIFRDAITRNPDNDQNYLSLALLQLRQQDIAAAKETLLSGQKRVPGSGKILWGLGVASALEDRSIDAEAQLGRAVDLLPEWPGSYSTLGVFYFQTGQIAKAKDVLSRFRNTNEHGGFDLSRIEQVLDQAPEGASTGAAPMTSANKQQFLALTLTLADKTL